MNKQKGGAIFVGGVGRSGTTPVAETLGMHPDLYVFPKELRFITDPDGLISLKSALVDNWSFFNADFAMERFKKLMKHLSTKYIGKYPTNGLKNYVTKEYYYDWVDNYVNSLVKLSFKSAWVGRANLFRKVLLRYLGKNLFTDLALERSYYCSPVSEEYFYSKTRDFIINFFDQAARLNGKKVAVEHTPLSLIHADFLYKTIPGMKLIHVHRDPRDIASSFGTRDWGVRDMKFNFGWIADTYNRWEKVKEGIPQDSYYEVALEKFIYDFEAQTKKICDFLNVQFYPEMLNTDISRHNIGRWKKSMSEEDLDYLNKNHGSLLQKYGYFGNES